MMLRQRRPRIEKPAHLAFIRTLPSLVPGSGPVEAAHIRYGDLTYGKDITGMGQKPSDCWTVPLAHDVHMEQHHFGNERDWWAQYGIDPLFVAALLWLHSGDHEAARTVMGGL
jgi:hypothetical protein